MNDPLLRTIMGLLLSIGLVLACGDDESGGNGSDPEPMDADAVSNVAADDVGNNQDASDLQVTFDKAADEVTVSEYRVIVVKSGAGSGFDTSPKQTSYLGRQNL